METTTTMDEADAIEDARALAYIRPRTPEDDGDEDTGPFCDACGEDCATLALDPADKTRLLCPDCHAEQVAEIEAEAREQAIMDADQEIDEAEYEVESLLEDLKGLKEQIADARRTLQAARKRRAGLNERGGAR